ncbi:MAG: hypothetical protein ACLR1G_13785 [Alistipes indistinctus]
MRNLLILAAILLIASGATAQETARLFTATTFSATDSPSGEPRKPKAQPPQSAQQRPRRERRHSRNSPCRRPDRRNRGNGQTRGKE